MNNLLTKKDVLEPYLETQKFIIDAVDGSETIAKAYGFIANDGFDEFETAQAGSTQEREMEIHRITYEIVSEESMTYRELLKFIHPDPDKLCLSQHQLLNLMNKYKNELPDDGGMQTPLKIGGLYLIAHFEIDKKGDMRIYRRYFSSRLNPHGLQYLVVPKII